MINIDGLAEPMGYDRAIVTFSPDGRLFQVEYAREAVKRGTTCLGLIFKDGVIITASRPLGPLALPNHGSDKVHQIDDHLGVAVSGFLADGRILVDEGRIKSQIHKLTYDEPLSVRGAVKEIADRMQLFTQYGGVRPYGVALLFGGIDENGPELFEIDPSSTFYNWKAHVIGRGATESGKVLRKGWKDGMDQEEALKLAMSALKAGEKNAKPTEIELIIITKKGFVKYIGETGAKFLKKYL